MGNNLIELKVMIGDNIDSVARRMMDHKKSGELNEITFNGVYLSTKNLNSIDEIINFYRKTLKLKFLEERKRLREEAKESRKKVSY